MTDVSAWNRHVFAPSVPEGVRRRLIEESACPSMLPALLGGLTGVLFGVACIVLLASGVQQGDADPLLIQGVAGGGLLMVGVIALAACLRAARWLRSVRDAHTKWAERAVMEGELAEVAVEFPRAGVLLRAGFGAIDEIRDSIPYRHEWLEGAFDPSAAEWSLAVEAQRARRTGTVPSSFSGLVGSLVELSSVVERLSRTIEQQRTEDPLTLTLTMHRPANRPDVLAWLEELTSALNRRDGAHF